MSETATADNFSQMTTGQLWGAVWGGLNAADTFHGRWQEEAQERHERAWAELVSRGVAKFRMFGGEHEADR